MEYKSFSIIQFYKYSGHKKTKQKKWSNQIKSKEPEIHLPTLLSLVF